MKFHGLIFTSGLAFSLNSLLATSLMIEQPCVLDRSSTHSGRSIRAQHFRPRGPQKIGLPICTSTLTLHTPDTLMSLSRIFAPELRPFFRALDDPFGRGSLASAFNHPLFNDPNFRRTDSGISPAVDVTESADGYVVHAEIPGVAKENINVSLSDAGRSLNINGRVVLRQGGTDTDEAAAPAPAAAPSHDTAPPPTEAPKKEEGTKLYNERTFVQDTTFSRTIHLPYPVDPTGVKAKLEHGVLTVTLSKLHDNDNKAIVID